MATTIRGDQLATLREFAAELDRIEGATRIGMPPTMIIRQIQRALPGLVQRLRALITQIEEAH